MDETIFEKHYQDYLDQLGDVSLKDVADRLGADFTDGVLSIAMFNEIYSISPEGISGARGETPTYDHCVVLSKYVLMCPDTMPEHGQWVGYREFRDAAPLIHYFTNAVEGTAADHFSGKLARLTKAAQRIGGQPPELNISYDLACQFNALPRVPLILLFNDADDEFKATCSILFRLSAQDYLDAECLAMLGHRLVRQLKKKM